MVSILIPAGVLLALYWGRYFGWQRKKGVPLTVPLAFTCLFIPKINLFGIGDVHNPAGFRADDFLALLMLIIAIRDVHTWKDKRIRWGIGFLIALTAAGLVSMLLGRANGFENHVLFSILSIIRKYEYFAFTLIGIYAARRTPQAEKAMMTEFIWISAFHAAVGLLQVAKACNYAMSGAVMDVWWLEGCAISTFNGYYEYGQFLCYGVVIFLCAFLRTKKIGYLGGVLGSCGMIWLSHSRSSLMVGLALIVLVLLFSIRKTTPLAVKIGAGVGMALIAAAGVLVFSGAIKVANFGNINFKEYGDAFRSYMEQGDIRVYAQRVRERVRDESVMTVWIPDWSAAIRFYKWGHVMDGFRRYPIFGYGTGVTEVADGNYVKLLGEGGLVGLLLTLGMLGYFFHALWKERKSVPAAKSVLFMIVSVLIGAVLIDMFEASKPMETLWLAVGLVIGVSGLKSEENNHLSGERV